MKILIVEDEIDLITSFLDFAKKEQYHTDIASTYREAAEKVDLYTYDCIMLDIGLPDGNGLDILTRLKAINKNDGVIIISAKDSLNDRVAGLNLGADDYLTKPFYLSELNARIQAVIRRKKFDASYLLKIANVQLDVNGRDVSVNGLLLNLTKKEFDILQHLAANRNRVITKNSLAEYIWGDHIDNTDSFDFLFQHLKNLKKKLKSAEAAIEIRTVYGVGYQIIEKK